MSATTLESILSGSASIEATLRMAVGRKLTPTGKETLLYASIRMGRLSADETQAVAIDRDMALLVKLSKTALVNITLPNVKDATLSIQLRPVMLGERCAVLFAIKSGRSIPSHIPSARVREHCAACKLDVPAEHVPTEHAEPSTTETQADTVTTVVLDAKQTARLRKTAKQV